MARTGRKVNRPPGVEPKQFGHIPGVPVGAIFIDRVACSEKGVHAPLQAGIHGSTTLGAYSVVLSGGYPDDEDLGDVITYTGQGGRTYYPNKMKQMQDKKSFTGTQNAHQTWTSGNLALKRSMEQKRPVRVIRGASLDSKFAPVEGYRYDGLYRVTEAYIETGKEGFKMCRFRFVRDPDQPPLPNASSGSRIIKSTAKRRRVSQPKEEHEAEAEDSDEIEEIEDDDSSSGRSKSPSPICKKEPPPKSRAPARGYNSMIMKKLSARSQGNSRFNSSNPDNQFVKRGPPKTIRGCGTSFNLKGQ